MVRIQNDWAYIYFLIPSIISFLLSLYVIAKNIAAKENMKKSFHQLTTLIALFSAIQCISWFHARYEKETLLCRVQEYIFQFGTLFEAFTAVVLCSLIYKTIRYGQVTSLNSSMTYIWFVLAGLTFITSCGFNTASLFCKFNKQNELYLPGMTTEDATFVPLIGYCCFYLLPLACCWLLTAFYSFHSYVYARRLAADSITMVARQLRLYPIMLAVCMFPLCTFFLIVLLTGAEVHWLLFIGAILTSSSGTINAVAYLTIVSKPSPFRQRMSTRSSEHFRGLGARRHIEGELTSSIMMGMEDIDDDNDQPNEGHPRVVGSSYMSSISISSQYSSSFEESGCDGGESSCNGTIEDRSACQPHVDSS